MNTLNDANDPNDAPGDVTLQQLITCDGPDVYITDGVTKMLLHCRTRRRGPDPRGTALNEDICRPASGGAATKRASAAPDEDFSLSSVVTLHPHKCRISWSNGVGHLTSVFLCVVDARRRGITLAEMHPDLAWQWHRVKNGELTPGDVASGTHRVVWWVAPCGHEWDMAVRLRTRKASSGCPYCAGKRVLPQDSLAAQRP